MGTVHRTLHVSETVVIEINSGDPLCGKIAWTNDLLIGVQFDAPVDGMRILHTPGRPATGRDHRMPRLNIPSTARILSGGLSRDVQVVDISQGGAKIEADFLLLGDRVVIAINGLEPCRGVICWSSRARAGISFNAPIAFNRLASWASL
ncbi:MAG: hypothetical protein JWR80_3489 [Bradyrhizobium sp.]|nr:hypothetical protein [Bradyrhizobium sp.]